MKRTLLVLATAMAMLSPLAPLAPPATATLPSEAVVKDARGDVIKFKNGLGVATVDHDYDIKKVRGAVVGTNLVLMVRLTDLVRQDDVIYQRPDGWWAISGPGVQAQVYVNGAYRWAVNRTPTRGQADLEDVVAEEEVDCLPDVADYDDSGVAVRMDTVRDKVVYLVPLACVGATPGDVFRVSAQVSAGDRDPWSFHDASRKTPAFSF